MKIYTKGGDKGLTSLIGGKRIPKSDDRIEAYGSIDELIAFLGLLRDQEIEHKKSAFLLKVQDKLMTIAAILATDCDDCNIKIPELKEQDINTIEVEIDLLNESLPSLNSFVLPGGHQSASLCHVARTVCRRAERKVIGVNEYSFVPPLVIQYLNRLSDYLFVLSRSILFDLQIDEIKWIPKVD
ncbi:MAG: cob(I)yrinic acid a,c-diamide adenosyltransferase [Bacteroidales bacterium]|nr:cob(I)yrinic acid a,c-diamide adenosyltransferase [Bacteroidales bacterium]